jgi:class 3 adenylate cyclase
VFRIYLDFLKVEKAWSPERISTFLSQLGTSLPRLSDDSTWFDLDFADRFYEAIVRETGDETVAYHAGLFVHRQSFSPVISQMIRALLKISLVYKFVSRFADHFSKAAKLSVLSAHGNTVTIEAIPAEGVKERAYICENRKGIFSGVPLVFGLPAAVIEESECIQRGDARCLYNIQWKEQRSFLPWILLPAISLALVLIFRSTFTPLTLVCAVGFFNALVISIYLITKAKLQQAELRSQNDFLDKGLSEIERKNKQLEVVGKISRLTQSLMSPSELGQTLVEAVCNLLEYDRALLLLTDFQRQVLEVKAYHGFPQKMKDLLSQTEFRLSSDNSSGFFVKVVNSKQPVLIQDVDKVIQQLSARSQSFAKMLGAKSFVAVPLLDERQNVLGVLAVDYVGSQRQMTIADQDLLMTLGGHLAISLHNAKTLDQLEENLQISRTYSDQQKILRETFQKFVPTDLAHELISGSGGDLFERLLKRVKKRSVAILIGDIVGFSTMTESMPAEDVVDLVNTVFSKLEPKISSHSGFVDKFTGDGFIAVFEDPEGCTKACASAIEMMQALTSINEDLFQKGYPKICFGFGINHGEVILGNVGSVDRLNFTVMGEAVNLASRLESHTRSLGDNTICVSSPVFHRAKEKFQWRDLGSVQIKGYRENIHAYELLVEQSESSHSPSRHSEKGPDS